jgi:3-hydroxybutyryl-CoA dehydrogenase
VGSGLQTVAILGAGDEGVVAARLASLAGTSVRLWDASEASLRAGVLLVRIQLERAVREGSAPTEHRQQIMDGVLATTDLAEALAGADAVLDTGAAAPRIRQEVLARAAALEPAVPLVTTGPVADLAVALPDPSRLAGLVLGERPGLRSAEPVAGPATGARALEAARDLAALLASAAVVHPA